MRRILLVAVAAVVTAPLQAQPRGPGMRGGFGAPPPPQNGFRMIQLPRTPPPFGPGYGFGGGIVTGGFGYNPYFVAPPAPVVVVGGGGGSVPSAPAEPSGALLVSGILPATLVLEYPAAAKVWLNGVEVPGDADTTWTFTSRDLKPGETATFRVRGRWAANGKTFESVREVPLGPGARSRLLVVTGTEVRD